MLGSYPRKLRRFKEILVAKGIREKTSVVTDDVFSLERRCGFSIVN